jgi:hypothetical protein
MSREPPVVARMMAAMVVPSHKSCAEFFLTHSKASPLITLKAVGSPPLFRPPDNLAQFPDLMLRRGAGALFRKAWRPQLPSVTVSTISS